MKVAVFTESLPPSTDGVAKTMTRLRQSLVTKNIESLFISPFQPEDSLWEGSVIKVSSVPFIFYSDYRVGLPLMQNITEILDRFRPDIIHAASPTPLGYTAVNYARKRNIPAVSSYHTNFVSYFKYYGFQSLENFGWSFLRSFYNRFSRIYAPSKSTADDLESRGFRNVELWQRGINLERFSPSFRSEQLRKQAGISDEPVLLFVGRIVKEKDIDDLVKATGILKRDGYRFKMVFVGNGPMLPQLERECPDAVFTGYQYGESLARWYASADIFTFPSTTETFGNVILEAQASGLPVVGVNQGGVADLIQDGSTGFIAGANNPESFAARLKQLLDNPVLAKQMGNNGRLVVKDNSWESVNSRLFDSYGRTLAQFHNLMDSRAA